MKKRFVTKLLAGIGIGIMLCAGMTGCGQETVPESKNASDVKVESDVKADSDVKVTSDVNAEIDAKVETDIRDYVRTSGLVSLTINVYVAALGNDSTSALTLDQWHIRDDYDTVMTSETAENLIVLLNALPDVYGNAEDPLAYQINYCYYDQEKNQHWREIKGCGSFPESWNDIVSCITELGKHSDYSRELTSNTNIITVEDILSRHHMEDMLPDGVSIEKFIEDTGISVADTGTGNEWGRTDMILYDFLYDYYDLGSHMITESSVPVASDSASLMEYAKEHLEKIVSIDDTCIRGKCFDTECIIVRFDCFETWKAKNTDFDQYLTLDNKIVFMRYVPEVFVTENVYVDPTGRFLIIMENSTRDIESIVNEFF